MKWKKPKDSKALQEKSAYGKIKQAEKVANWSNVCYPNKDAVALEKEWSAKKTRMFAKHCWENRYKHSPSGMKWEDVFYKTEGMTLTQYIADFVRK